MAYLLQTVAKEPSYSNIVTLTISGRSCHAVTTQLLYNLCNIVVEYTDSRGLILQRESNQY